MASLEKRYGGRYRIVFCWQGERSQHSLGKLAERDARSCLDHLEESLRFVERGLLEVPNIENFRHFAPLHSATANGDVEIARLLLNNGAYPSPGHTPLDLARTLHSGNAELLRLLQEACESPVESPDCEWGRGGSPQR